MKMWEALKAVAATLAVVGAVGAGGGVMTCKAIAADVPAPKPARAEAAKTTTGPSLAGWPCWRGPNRNGISLETGFNWEWPKEGLAPAWKANIGSGFSSVAVKDGRVFTTGKNHRAKGDEAKLDAIWCADAESGAILWASALPMYDKKFINVWDQGSCSTPAVDDKAVYGLNNRGGAAAFDVKEGRLLWEHDLTKDPGILPPGYYWAASPLVEGNVVIHSGGSSGIALDKTTGKTVWDSGTGAAGHVSPVSCDVDGKRVAVIVSGDISAVDTADGTVLYLIKRNFWPLSGNSVVDPIIMNNQIEWAGHLLKFENKAIVVDKSNRKDTAGGIGASYCMPIVWKGCVFAAHFTPRSSKDPGVNSKLIDFTYRCRDFATGEVKWEKEGLTGIQILVDNKILLLGIDGNLTAFDASPDGYKETGKTLVFPGYKDGDQGTHCVSAPAFADGRIYCRKGGQLLCYDVRKK